MSEGINRVLLLGRLGFDPELRFGQSGGALLTMRLATTETYFDKEKVKQERTDWHSVVLFGKRAEALSKLLEKGREILVEGRLQTRSYEDKDGNKRHATEVVANNIVLTGGRSGGGDGAVKAADLGGKSSGGGYGRGGSAKPGPRSYAEEAEGFGDDGDVPF